MTNSADQVQLPNELALQYTISKDGEYRDLQKQS